MSLTGGDLGRAGTPVKPEKFRMLQAPDSQLSEVALEDFLRQLIPAMQRARGDRAAIARLAPYISPGIHLARRPGVERAGIATLQLVFAKREFQRIVDGHLDGEAKPGHDEILLYGLSKLVRGGKAYVCTDLWMIRRDIDVTSKPVRVQTWTCPKCDAPWSARPVDANECASCRLPITPGRFDWTSSCTRRVSESTSESRRCSGDRARWQRHADDAGVGRR